MKRIFVGAGLVAVLVMPAAASAKVTKADRQGATQECRAERGDFLSDPADRAAAREAFNATYGSNGKEGTKGFRRNAFGKCRSQRAKEEAAERRAARRAAKQQCDQKNDRARSRCVARRSRKLERRADRRDRREIRAQHNAAAVCAERRETMGRQEFADAYGANGKEGKPGYHRNAFGKCVSRQRSEEGDSTT